MSPVWKGSVRLAGLAATGLVGYQSTLLFLDQRRQSVSQLIPSVPDIDKVPVTSPVRVLDLAAANAKLRGETRSFPFDSSDGAKGRVDVVRLASNNPIEDEWALAVGGGVGDAKGTLYAGVYDGHAGWATSAVLKQALIPYVSSHLGKLPSSSQSDAVTAAIKRAFVQLDNRIMDTAEQALRSYAPASAEALAPFAPAAAGSCALLTIFDPISSTLRTAVAGDSRAVLGSWDPAVETHAARPLSVDQTGFNEEEVARLERLHPGETGAIIDPTSGRLLGMAITRAFGDHRWKWPLELVQKAKRDFFAVSPRPRYATPPYMTAEPEVTTTQVRTDDFAILASDGLWDHISSEDAVACISTWLAGARGQKKLPEIKDSSESGLVVDKEDWLSWRATPEDFVFEDGDNAAVCLVKNAFGGRRRELFRGVMTSRDPLSRYVRDDVTVMVIFFRRP